MGRIFKRYLEVPQIYACSSCGTHVTSNDQVISKSFNGKHGKAYLVESCVNVYYGSPERRVLMTGLHICVDMFCIGLICKILFFYLDI